jgi:hypothetical protein
MVQGFRAGVRTAPTKARQRPANTALYRGITRTCIEFWSGKNRVPAGGSGTVWMIPAFTNSSKDTGNRPVLPEYCAAAAVSGM